MFKFTVSICHRIIFMNNVEMVSWCKRMVSEYVFGKNILKNIGAQHFEICFPKENFKPRQKRGGEADGLAASPRLAVGVWTPSEVRRFRAKRQEATDGALRVKGASVPYHIGVRRVLIVAFALRPCTRGDALCALFAFDNRRKGVMRLVQDWRGVFSLHAIDAFKSAFQDAMEVPREIERDILLGLV